MLNIENTEETIDSLFVDEIKAVPVILKTKTCKSCNETKSVTDFPKIGANTAKESWAANCKSCKNKRAKELRDQKKQGIVSSPKVTEGKALSSWQQLLNLPEVRNWLDVHNTPNIYRESFMALRKSTLGDRDSWKAREYHSAICGGWKHVDEKDGADAYDKDRPVEMKINWANGSYDYGKSRPLNGHGSFNDYNQHRLDRLYEQDYKMAIPFYVDDQLIAMATFDARHPEFFNRLQSQLDTNTKGRVAPCFTHKNWLDAASLEWVILPIVQDLRKYQHLISEDILDSLADYMTREMKARGKSKINLTDSQDINWK